MVRNVESWRLETVEWREKQARIMKVFRYLCWCWVFQLLSAGQTLYSQDLFQWNIMFRWNEKDRNKRVQIPKSLLQKFVGVGICVCAKPTETNMIQSIVTHEYQNARYQFIRRSFHQTLLHSPCWTSSHCVWIGYFC